MERWNQGDHGQRPQKPSIYEKTLPAKLDRLEQLQALCDRAFVTPDSYQPSLQGQIGGAQVKARCAYNRADVLSLDMQGLTPEQVEAVLNALRG
jgi:hypothetical protein